MYVEVVVEEASSTKFEAYVRYLRARTAMSVAPLVKFASTQSTVEM